MAEHDDSFRFFVLVLAGLALLSAWESKQLRQRIVQLELQVQQLENRR